MTRDFGRPAPSACAHGATIWQRRLPPLAQREYPTYHPLACCSPAGPAAPRCGVTLPARSAAGRSAPALGVRAGWPRDHGPAPHVRGSLAGVSQWRHGGRPGARSSPVGRARWSCRPVVMRAALLPPAAAARLAVNPHCCGRSRPAPSGQTAVPAVVPLPVLQSVGSGVRSRWPPFCPIPAWPMLAILLWGIWPPPPPGAVAKYGQPQGRRWPAPWNQPRYPSACWNGTTRPAGVPVFYLVAGARDPLACRRTPMQIPVHVPCTVDTAGICGSYKGGRTCPPSQALTPASPLAGCRQPPSLALGAGEGAGGPENRAYV